MLTLSLLDVHWLDATDPLDDQCAHGTVKLEIGDQVLISPEDGEITVSAAALNLLRTLDRDHASGRPVAEGCQLFPCCGFSVWLGGERFPVLIVGCPSGVEMDVSHTTAGVAVRSKGVESVVSEHAWQSAVISFARSVLAFYEREAPRNPIQDTDAREGWRAFWKEYGERLHRHSVAV